VNHASAVSWILIVPIALIFTVAAIQSLACVDAKQAKRVNRATASLVAFAATVCAGVMLIQHNVEPAVAFVIVAIWYKPSWPKDDVAR